MAQVSNMTAAERATAAAAGGPVSPTLLSGAPMQTTSVTTEERRAVRGGWQGGGAAAAPAPQLTPAPATRHPGNCNGNLLPGCIRCRWVLTCCIAEGEAGMYMVRALQAVAPGWPAQYSLPLAMRNPAPTPTALHLLCSSLHCRFQCSTPLPSQWEAGITGPTPGQARSEMKGGHVAWCRLLQVQQARAPV